jgi:hypothetical protein
MVGIWSANADCTCTLFRNMGNSNLILANCGAHRDHSFCRPLHIYHRLKAAQSFHSGMPKSSRVKTPFLIWSKASSSIINARFSCSSLPSLDSTDDPQIRFIFGMASRMRLSMASVSRRGVPQRKRFCTPQLRKSRIIIYKMDSGQTA